MVQVGLKTDRGLKRRNNEDAGFVMPDEQIYMIADGLGGYNSGEVASREAMSILADGFKENPISDVQGTENIRDYLIDAIKEANYKIWMMATSSEEYKNMATTLVLVYIHRKQAYIANVGDSRAYLFRKGELVQITEDHSIVAEMVKSGQIEKEEARNHPERNQITRAIGAEATVVPNIYQVRLEKEDMLLLCTDGLYGELSDEKIIDILKQSTTMSETCTELVTQANRAGGHDNITVVCLKI